MMYKVTLRRQILLSVEKAEMGLAVFYSHVMGVWREGTTMLGGLQWEDKRQLTQIGTGTKF